MKTTLFTRLAAGLLTLAGPALAQTQPTGPSAQLTLAELATRPVLGGPPQPAASPAAPGEPIELAVLRQLPLAAGPPAPTELARVFAPGVRPLASFRPDIAALATARVVPGSRLLVALALPLSMAGVPTGGATPGQHLKLLTVAGEQLVAVARPAAAGSHVLVVAAEAGLAGQAVFVVGLEHPAEQALNYEALTLLSLGAAQQLAQQLAAVQQQLAALRSQLATAQQVNSALLLDHAGLTDLRQQLSLLQSQQAAAFSVARQRRGLVAE